MLKYITIIKKEMEYYSGDTFEKFTIYNKQIKMTLHGMLSYLTQSVSRYLNSNIDLDPPTGKTYDHDS